MEVTAVCDWVALPSSRPVGSAQGARHPAQESGDPGPARGWRLAQPQAGERGGVSHRRPGNLGKSTWRPCSWNSPVVPARGKLAWQASRGQDGAGSAFPPAPWPSARLPALPAAAAQPPPPAAGLRGVRTPTPGSAGPMRQAVPPLPAGGPGSICRLFRKAPDLTWPLLRASLALQPPEGSLDPPHTARHLPPACPGQGGCASAVPRAPPASSPCMCKKGGRSPARSPSEPRPCMAVHRGLPRRTVPCARAAGWPGDCWGPRGGRREGPGAGGRRAPLCRRPRSPVTLGRLGDRVGTTALGAPSPGRAPGTGRP